jgi:hypothetical protein
VIGSGIVALSVVRDLHGQDGGLADRYRLGDSGAVLVRPDGYVAWRRSPWPERGSLQFRTVYDEVWLHRPSKGLL